MTLSIPVAGNYLIFSKVPMDDVNAGARTQQCILTAGTDSDSVFVTTNGIGGWACNDEVVHTFAAPGIKVMNWLT